MIRTLDDTFLHIGRGCADADRAVNDGAAIASVTRPENLLRLPKDQPRDETDAAGGGARNRHLSLVARVTNRMGQLIRCCR
jgi:hypothetical protein